MRLIRLRFSSLTSTVAGLLFLAACSDAFAPEVIEVIEETNFAPSLNIDLGSMTRTSSGLYIETISEGTGEPAVAGNDATVLYVGFLSNGDVFDSSDQSGPFNFILGTGGAVDGFDEGVLGMKLGGIRLIIMPPSLGYGNSARGSIPAGSILIFRIELESIG